MEHTPDKKRVSTILLDILTAYPGGIKEYEFIKILQKNKVSPFAESDLGDELDLFQSHFLLFHLLYTLRDRLHQEQQGDIEIHCLGIVLRPWQQSVERVPEIHDPMRVYYLNLDNMEGLQKESVIAMLDDFWQQFARWDGRADALLALGLREPVNKDEIKHRYRKLAFEHHPDHGGDPEQFRRVKQAADILLSA